MGSLKALATFVVVLVALAWPWPSVRVGFSQVLCALGNPAFEHVRIEPGSSFAIAPLPVAAPRQPTDNVLADTQVLLTQASSGHTARLGLSLRRDAYLPLVIFLALVAAAPLGLARKAACVAVGVPVVLGVALLSIYWLVLQLTTVSLAAFSGGWSDAAVAFLFERWLSPWENRVIAPLLLAALLASFFYVSPGGAPRARRPRSTQAQSTKLTPT